MCVCVRERERERKEERERDRERGRERERGKRGEHLMSREWVRADLTLPLHDSKPQPEGGAPQPHAPTAYLLRNSIKY